MIRKITASLVVFTLIGLVLWDVFAMSQAGTVGTISDVISTAAVGHPAIPFAFGLVCGHWFWGE